MLDQERATFAGSEPLLGAFGRESRLNDLETRTLLAKFGLGPDEVAQAGRSLSRGERTRAVLAVLLAQGANCLLLDEPTNHLDLPAIEELERALADFAGTAVLVTHDRRLLERFDPTWTFELPGS